MIFKGLKSMIEAASLKTQVLTHIKDGTFDKKDKERLKPMTRLRKDEEELEKEKNGDIMLRIKDWQNDIDRRQ